MNRLFLTALTALALTAGTTLTASASNLRFAFARDVAVQSKGVLEYEQWFTFKDYDGRERYEFRHELEYGLSDTTQLGFYLSDWRHTENADGSDKTEWRTAGLEVIHLLSNPTTDPVGAALYGELLAGPKKIALEGKLLLQKNVGPFAFLYNFVLEAEWEGEKFTQLNERTGVIENLLGVSYQVTPNFFVGAEAMHKLEMANWEGGDHTYYAGPNVSLRKGDFFLTTAAFFQISETSGEPDTQVRMKLGFHF